MSQRAASDPGSRRRFDYGEFVNPDGTSRSSVPLFSGTNPHDQGEKGGGKLRSKAQASGKGEKGDGKPDKKHEEARESQRLLLEKLTKARRSLPYPSPRGKGEAQQGKQSAERNKDPDGKGKHTSGNM